MALRATDLPESNKSAERTYTVAEWLKMPVRRPYTELVDGKLEKMTAGTPNHGRIIFNLRMALQLYVLTHSLGQVDSEMNVIINGVTERNGWIPDLAFAAKNTSLEISDNWYGIPDWVLEVWAGGEKRSGRISEKRRRWEQAGVPELWEVIWRKDQQIVKIYRLSEGRYQEMPTDGQAQLCSQVIEGFCMERAAIFANLVQEQ